MINVIFLNVKENIISQLKSEIEKLLNIEELIVSYKFNPPTLLIRNGIEAINLSEVKTKSILITNEKKIPVDFLNYNIIICFSLPVNYNHLAQVIQEQFIIKNEKWKYNKNLIPCDDGYRLFNDYEIIRLEAEKNFTLLYLQNNKKLAINKSLKYFENELSFNFFRIHHKHIVNLSYVTQIILRNNCFIKLDNDIVLPVSVRKKNYLINYLSGK